MKAFRLLFALVLILPLHALHAEIQERALLSVNIPFAFTVDDVRLPAGQYVIYSVHTDHLWRLSGFRRGATTFFTISADQAASRSRASKLVFRRYGSEYVLHEINYGPEKTNATLSVGKRERQLVRGKAEPEIAMVDAQTGMRRE